MLEVQFALDDDSAIILSLSSADDAEGLVDYETQNAVAYSTVVMEHVGLIAEFIDAEEFGGDEDSGVTLQLAVEM